MNRANLHIEIIEDFSKIRSEWSGIIPEDHFYLSAEYLEVLMNFPPKDYDMRIVCFRKADKLVGGGLLQFVMFRTAEKLRYNFAPNWLKRMLNAIIVCFGNFTVTDDKPFYFLPEIEDIEKAQMLRKLILESFQYENGLGGKAQLFLLKELDTSSQDLKWISDAFPTMKQHQVQPSMLFSRDENWAEFNDYLYALKSDYRMAYRRYQSKGKVIEFKELSLEELIHLNSEIYALYKGTASQAGFNSFDLHEDYFVQMKAKLSDQFKCITANVNGEIYGFFSLIEYAESVDAHFIGMKRKYSENVYLYNNMLYEMLKWLFELDKIQIHFSRTALESKSAIGAKPKELVLLSQHVKPVVNGISKPVFEWLYPGEKWRLRHPFRQGKISTEPRI